jgi:hypothetical protein
MATSPEAARTAQRVRVGIAGFRTGRSVRWLSQPEACSESLRCTSFAESRYQVSLTCWAPAGACTDVRGEWLADFRSARRSVDVIRSRGVVVPAIRNSGRAGETCGSCGYTETVVPVPCVT